MPGRVAVHQERDRPGRRQHRRLRVAVAVLVAELDRLVPAALRGLDQLALDPVAVELVGGVAVHPHDRVVGLAVLRVLVVGADRGGDLGRLAVAAAGHQRGDRAGDVAALVGVVGDAVGHQQRAEVGVAEPELAEGAGVVADLLGRVARGLTTISWARKTMSTVCSNSAVSKEPSARRNFIRLIEARLQAESSTCMYSEHGFEALIRPDSGQVCQRLMIVSYWTPGIGAPPGGVGDLVHQLAGLERLRRLAVRCGRSGPSRRRPRPPP